MSLHLWRDSLKMREKKSRDQSAWSTEINSPRKFSFLIFCSGIEKRITKMGLYLLYPSIITSQPGLYFFNIVWDYKVFSLIIVMYYWSNVRSNDRLNLRDREKFFVLLIFLSLKFGSYIALYQRFGFLPFLLHTYNVDRCVKAMRLITNDMKYAH